MATNFPIAFNFLNTTHSGVLFFGFSCFCRLVAEVGGRFFCEKIIGRSLVVFEKIFGIFWFVEFLLLPVDFFPVPWEDSVVSVFKFPTSIRVPASTFFFLLDDPSNKFGYSHSAGEHSSGKGTGKTLPAVRPVLSSKAAGATALIPHKSELNDEDILQVREMGKFQPDWVYEEWLPIDISRINTRHGRVSLSVCFLKSKAGFRVFKELIGMGSYSRKDLANLPIWSIEISENQEDEDRIPGYGYCGYLAMDQILNGWAKCVDIETEEGQECVIGTMERLIGHEDVHPNGRLTIPPVTGPIRDVVMSLIKEIDENSHPISLPRARWMSGGMVNNLCPTQKFSRWIPADNGMLQLIESQFDSRCRYLTDNECRRIVDEYMLVQAFEHFYVRKGELMENFHSAMRSAHKKFSKVSLLARMPRN